MKLITLNRAQVEKENCIRDSHTIISIYNSGDEPPKLKTNEHTLATKFFQFDDVDLEEPGKVVFNENLAREIKNFIYGWPSAEIVVCQCEAGQSRSVGLAAALAKFFNDDDLEFFEGPGMYAPARLPNMHVYRVMLNLLHEEPLKIYRLVYSWVDDDDESWDECVVVAEDSIKALSAAGYTTEDKVHCEYIGVAAQGETGTGVICHGTHEYPKGQSLDRVKLAMDFFPQADAGATGTILGVELTCDKKFIRVAWDKDNDKWHGMPDKFYNAVWFDVIEDDEEDLSQ